MKTIINERHPYFKQSYEIPPTDFKSRPDNKSHRLINNTGDNPLDPSYDSHPEDVMKVSDISDSKIKTIKLNETDIINRLDVRMKQLNLT